MVSGAETICERGNWACNDPHADVVRLKGVRVHSWEMGDYFSRSRDAQVPRGGGLRTVVRGRRAGSER